MSSAPPARRPSPSTRFDAIIVGGGHNGLVTAAYLARAGLRPLVLEARWKVGGAATTETPWGPDYKVTALSYVMSLMPPQIINDLKLKQFGYHVIPMGPSYLPLLDGKRSLTLTGDPKEDHAAISAFSTKDADAYLKYERVAEADRRQAVTPCCSRHRPRSGSMRPADLLGQAKLAWGMRGLDVRGSADVTRLFTMSIADLLDEWFESPELKGLLCVNGVIGTWAGPYEPGTAYVMLHHSIGDVGDGQMQGTQGSWGFPIGGMGAVSKAIADSAQSFGAVIKTDARVARILVRGGRTYGVALEDGTEYRADTVIAATHPKITFLDQLDERELPEDFVGDIKRWRSRSGMVKVNVALDGLPEFSADPDLVRGRVHRGARDVAEHGVHRAGVHRRPGGPRRGASVQRRRDPLDGRLHAGPRGSPHHVDVHPVGAAHVGRRPAAGGARGVRRPGHRPVRAGRTGLHQPDPAPSGDRPARDADRVQPDRRQHDPRRAVGGPAVPHAPSARLRRLHDSDLGSVPGVVGDARRRWASPASPATRPVSGSCPTASAASCAARAEQKEVAPWARPRRTSRRLRAAELEASNATRAPCCPPRPTSTTPS